MAIVLKRTIYTQSDVVVDNIGNANALKAFVAGAIGWSAPHGGGDTRAIVNTAQNATMTLNIPRADVNVFGVEGTIARPQLEAETATMEFTFIPEKQGSPAFASTLTDTDMDALIKDTISQTHDYVTVESAGVGKLTLALMNSFTGDATVGALPTFTCSFTGAQADKTNPQNLLDVANAGGAGVADPSGDAHGVYVSDTAGNTIEDAPLAVADIAAGQKAEVVTPQDIKLFVAGNAPANLVDEDLEPGGDADHDMESCAQSASFSWDVPVETILCLGADPASQGIALGNPPGTASFTVEALMAQLVSHVAAQDYILTVGSYQMTLHSGNIDSRTHNLAVGDLFGTYNYVIGGTGDGFRVA